MNYAHSSFNWGTLENVRDGDVYEFINHQGKPLPHVFFQPRFEPWYEWHKQFNNLPLKLDGLSLLDVYDLIGASMRTVHYYTGQPDPIETRFTEEVNITEERGVDRIRYRYDTPHGLLFQTVRLTVDKTWRVVEFAAKTARDACATTNCLLL